jgi:outer membrane lipoprotein SlyB
MSDMREKFDDMDLRTKNLGATVAGALAGGFAGRAAGKSRLTMLAGAAAGALGGQAIATRNVERYVFSFGGVVLQWFLTRKQGQRGAWRTSAFTFTLALPTPKARRS